jgi:antitoxin ParD1/3/4
MRIVLKPEEATFVQTQIAKGNYQTAEEVMSQALALLQRQHEYEQWLIETRQKVEVGIAALERGEAVDGDVAIAQLRDRLHNRGSH